MDSKERRKYIKSLLNSDKPYKGQDLACDLGVTRQVIVKDIAILRAEGLNIIATPEGYIFPSYKEKFLKKVIAVCHRKEDIKDELETIIKYGAVVDDVIVEHSVYGEIRAMLMLRTIYDLENYMKKIEDSKVKPLSSLTEGIHLHTITIENEDNFIKIIKELKEKNYLVED